MTLSARARLRPLRAGLVCAGLHSVCYALMFPPVFLYGLAWVARAPLMWLAWAVGEGNQQSSKAQIANEEKKETRRVMRRALLGVYLGVIPMWGLNHWWIAQVTAAGFPVLILYLSLYGPLFVWLGARWRRRVGNGWRFWVALPALWVGLETLRGSVVFDGYPWFFVGHPLTRFGWILAPHGGVSVVSLAAAGSTSAVVWAMVSFPRASLGARAIGAQYAGVAAVGAVMIVPMALGSLLGPPVSGVAAPETAQIAVVQTNVPQDNKVAWKFEQRRADFERFKALTREAAEASPDCVVWPETMFPGLALNEDAVRAEREARLLFSGDVPSTIFHDELVALQKEIGVPMVVGAIAKDGLRFGSGAGGRISVDADATFNSAFVIAGGAVRPDRYDKMHLTPFGEYMPYISASKWLETKLLALGASGMKFDLETGKGYPALDVPLSEPGAQATGADGQDTPSRRLRSGLRNTLRIATPICFEATMPDVCRRLVYSKGAGWAGMLSPTRKADLIVNLTNDGWFGRGRATHENHLLLARWRCMELGVPMVRAANTGIPCSINDHGMVTTPALGGGWTNAASPAENIDREGVARMAVMLTPGRGPTLYARIGDLVGWLCLGATAILGALTFVRSGRPAATPS